MKLLVLSTVTCMVVCCSCLMCKEEGKVMTCNQGRGGIRLTNRSYGLGDEVIETVKHLHLEGCGVGDIDVFTFSNFRSLQDLHLQRNNLRQLSEPLFFNVKLTRLNLSSNNLLWLHPNAFVTNQSLECVQKLVDERYPNIPSNNFREAFKAIGSQLLLGTAFMFAIQEAKNFCTQGLIQDIDLSQNSLTYLPDELFANSSLLRRLDLNSNRLMNLPASLFGDRNSMKTLHLGRNHLLAFDVKKLRGLENLDLSDNKLTEINETTFETNHLLVNLNLRSNYISNLPPGAFTNNARLKLLDLGDNRISSVHLITFTNNRDLRFLNLGKNRMTSLSDHLFYYNRVLEKVGLNDNMITKIGKDTFKNNHIVEEIALYNNELDSFNVDAVKGLSNLRYLNLHNNYLKQLSGELLSFESLSELYISCNKLTEFSGTNSAVRGEYSRRLNLYMGINPWKCKCIDEVLKGEQNLTVFVDRKYFRDGLFPTCILKPKDKPCDESPLDNRIYQDWAVHLYMEPAICYYYETSRMKPIIFDFVETL